MTLTVATVTWVRDPAEQTRVRAGLECLARRFRVVAANRESNAIPGGFGHLTSLPNLTVLAPEQPGLVSQVRTAFAEAAGHGPDWILYAEPDKLEFFEDHLDAFLGQAAIAATPDTAVIIAGRSPSQLAALPRVQQEAEGLINTWTGRFTGNAGDYSYGPFLLAASCAHWVQSAGDELGWGWRHYIFGLCRRRNRRIAHIVGGYPSPGAVKDPGQEDLLRQRQLAENIRGLLHAANEP